MGPNYKKGGPMNVEMTDGVGMVLVGVGIGVPSLCLFAATLGIIISKIRRD